MCPLIRRPWMCGSRNALGSPWRPILPQFVGCVPFTLMNGVIWQGRQQCTSWCKNTGAYLLLWLPRGIMVSQVADSLPEAGRSGFRLLCQVMVWFWWWFWFWLREHFRTWSSLFCLLFVSIPVHSPGFKWVAAANKILIWHRLIILLELSTLRIVLELEKV